MFGWKGRNCCRLFFQCVKMGISIMNANDSTALIIIDLLLTPLNSYHSVYTSQRWDEARLRPIWAISKGVDLIGPVEKRHGDVSFERGQSRHQMWPSCTRRYDVWRYPPQARKRPNNIVRLQSGRIRQRG